VRANTNKQMVRNRGKSYDLVQLMFGVQMVLIFPSSY